MADDKKPLDLSEFGGAKPLDLTEFQSEPTQPAASSGALRRVADTGLALAKGVMVGVPETAVGLADLVTGGKAGKAVQAAGRDFKADREFLTSLQSPEQHAADAEVQAAKGFLPTVGAMVQNPSTIANALAESAPSMVVGGLAGRGLMAAKLARSPIAAGAAGEGVVTAGQNAEQVRQETADGLLTPGQSAVMAASGMATGAISAGAGRVAKRLGLGDIDTAIAAGKLAPSSGKGLLRRVAGGAVSEGVLEELPQSMQEQAAQNVALGRPIMEGVPEAGAAGMLVGGLTGAGVNVLQGAPERTTTTPPPAPQPVAPPPAAVAPTTPTTPVAPPVAGPNVAVSTTPPPQSETTGGFSGGFQAPPTPPAAPAPTPPQAPNSASAAMGLRRTAGPISSAAATAVDTGATLIEQHRQIKTEADDEASKAKTAGKTGSAAPSKPAEPAQQATARPAAPVTGPITAALSSATQGAPANAQGTQAQQGQAASAGGAPTDAGAAPGTGQPAASGTPSLPAAVPGAAAGAGQPSSASTLTPKEPSNAQGREIQSIDPDTGEITFTPANTGRAQAPADAQGDGAGATAQAQPEVPAGQPARLGEPAAAPPVQPAPQGPADSVDAAAHATAATSPTNDLPEPTPAQKEAGNYAVGRIKLNGLDVSVENPQGSTRSGVDKSGKPWSNTLKDHYGYLRGTKGADKDHFDVFIKPGTPLDFAGKVFVIDQVDPSTGKFDEGKAMIGYANALQARHAYQANYAPGWKGLKAITPMEFADFKRWVHDGPKNRPLSEEISNGKNNSRDDSDPGVAGVATRQEALQRPEESGLPALRGKGNPDVQGVGGKREGVPAGNGAKAKPGALSRSLAKHERELRTGQREVGDAAGAGGEPAVLPSDRVGRPEDDNSGSRKVEGRATDDLSQARAGGSDAGSGGNSRTIAVPQKLQVPDVPGADAGGSSVGKQAGRSSPDAAGAPAPRDADGARSDAQVANRVDRTRGPRQASWDKNPFMTLLGRHGLYHVKGDRKSLKTEFSPDQAIMVPGYPPVFRYNGLHVDQLLVYAIQDGFLLPDADERDLSRLIERAIRGERIAPVYAEGGDQAEFEREQAKRGLDDMEEAEPSLGDAPTHVVDALADSLDDVPDLWAKSNVSTVEAMRAMGFSEQEIQDEIALEQGRSVQADPRGAGAGQAPTGDQAEAGAQGTDEAPDAGAPGEGLTAPTPEEVVAKQEREAQALADEKAQKQAEQERLRKEAEDKESKARADATVDDFELGKTADQQLSGMDDMFSQPAASQAPEPTKPAEPTAPAEPPEAVPAPKAAAPTSILQAFKDTVSALYDGKASLEDYRAAYARVRDAEAVKAELGKMTKDQLAQTFGIMRDGKKDEFVDMAYQSMLRQFALGKEYGPRTYFLGAQKAYDKQKAEALDALVAGQTDDDLKAYAEQVAARRAENDERRAAVAKAIEDPKTIPEFRAFLEHHIRQGKTNQEARMLLTQQQRALMDDLQATETRSRRKDRTEAERTQVKVAGQTVDGEIIATKHTKKGHDLFVVRLSERVSREDYETLNAGAKRIGGYYSSFRGGGAIPGFQFTTREQAQAFVKLAQGDNAAAVEASKERRDAYQDDRSQSAAERLTEMADKMDEAADDSLALERKANTARRARFAAAAETQARAAKAMAKTMRNVAAALTDGKAKFLDRIRTRTQVELLQTYVASAKDAQLRAKYQSYAEQEKRKGQPPDQETADYAEFPVYRAYRSDLASLARQMLEIDGTKKLGQQLMKVADDMSDAFTAFAKEPGNLFRLSAFSVGAGDAQRTAIFKDRETAERSIKRSGLVGKAIVFPEKRGVNRIIMSPSEAIARGVWKGDGDKQITLSAEFGAELVEALGRANRHKEKVSVPWQFERAYERRKQLSKMGLETPFEFRAALREFIGLREQAAEADRIKELERAMIGKAKDGLDFFPTPEAVADEMIAAADIAPDMSVLEPSAGMGHIADRVRAAGAEPDVIELANDRRELLQEKGYHALTARDFLELKPREFFTYGDVFRAPDGVEGIMHGGRGWSGRASLHEILPDGTEGKMLGWYDRDELVGVRHRGSDSGYDRIVMNPPFSDGRDIQHVRHAYDLLKPGGRLVALMGESAFTNQNKRATEFREWLVSVGGSEEKLPEGSFMDPSLPVNTGANARMVVIEKAKDVAGEPSARYDAREPDAPYDQDLFGNPLPAPAGGAAKAKPAGTGLRGDVQSKPDLRDTPAPPGDYFVNTFVSTETQREIGVAKILTPEHAAQATAYLYRSAVERMDGIVTDKDGKPLAIVGGFKGALAQTSIYPATLVAEAVRIPGAAHIWFSHNHPSGFHQLSRADEVLTDSLTYVFNGSGIKPMGLMAVAGDKFQFKNSDPSAPVYTGNIAKTVVRKSIPVYERGLSPGASDRYTVSSPGDAKQIAGIFYAKSKAPGILLLDSQHKLAAWVPITQDMMQPLRKGGGLNAIYRAISQANAGAAVIVHGGELDAPVPGYSTRTLANNIGSALNQIDVRTLDAINVKTNQSLASMGLDDFRGGAFARGGDPFYSALEREISGVNAKTQPVMGWLATINGQVKAGKVKADEVEWSGLLDWLKMQQGKVTREQVMGFLAANGVKVEETVFGNGAEAARLQQRADELADDLDWLGFQVEQFYDESLLRRKSDKAEFSYLDGQWVDVDDEPVELPPGVAELAVELGTVRENLDFLPHRSDSPRYEQGNLVLPGGTNYREILLTLPPSPERRRFNELGSMKLGTRTPAEEAEYRELGMRESLGPTFMNRHWQQENVLAHIRVNDRTDADGKRVLFVEEIQSDWGQEGKKRGFRRVLTTAQQQRVAELNRITEERDFTDAEQAEYDSMRDGFSDDAGVPSAPFVTKTDAWVALALKRIIKLAVDEGYDRVAFVTGQQSEDRYWGNEVVRPAVERWNEVTKPQSIRELGEDVLGREMATLMPLDHVDAGVLAVLKHDQVRRAVVEAIPVDVVNMLRAVETSPDDLLRKKDVVASRLSVDSRRRAADGLLSALRLAGATIRAELGRLTPGGGDIEVLPALRASQLNTREVAGLLDPVRIFHRGAGGGPQGAATAGAGAEPLSGKVGWVGGREQRAAELAGLLNTHASILGRDGLLTQGVEPPPGEGMRAFYDKIVPSVLKDVLRKLGGGNLRTIDMDVRKLPNVPLVDGMPAEAPGFYITPAMRARAADGLPLFERAMTPEQLRRAGVGEQRMDTARVQRIVAPLVAKWDVDVRVVATPADLPVPAPSDARGMHWNGVIYVVARTNRTSADVLRTLAHETIAHYGVRAMLGREGYRKFVSQVQFAARQKDGPLREISDYVRRTYVDENGKFNLTPGQEGDEIAARAVELGVDPLTGEFKPGFGMLKAMFAKVMEFLRSLGLKITMSNAELQGILVRSMRNLGANPAPAMVGETASAARRPPLYFDAKESPLYERRTAEAVGVISKEQADKALQSDATSRRILAKGNVIKDGQPVGVRLNINVLKSTGVPVTSIHAGGKGEGYKQNRGWWGNEVLTYAPVVTLRDAYFNVSQRAREQIASGQAAKSPMASVDGNFVATEQHNFDGVEFRFNPKREHLFVDKLGRVLRSADEITVYGNHVYARGAIEYYGPEDVPARAGDAASVGRLFEEGGTDKPLFARAPAPDTPEFKAWFGDSKVVDAEGKPLVVYHGTPAGDIDVFKVSKSGSFGGGIYTTPDAWAASIYANEPVPTGRQAAPTVYPVYVSIKNPAPVSEAVNVGNWRGERAVRDTLMERGYDGVIDWRSGEIVAFRPEQIKSAIGNRGTFDPSNPDINFARAGTAQGLAEVTDTLRNLVDPIGKVSLWQKTVGTQFHKATKDADFKRVFDAYLQQTDDTAHYAIEAERNAPDILMRLDSVVDAAKALWHSGPKHKRDLEAVSKALFANIEGKEGVQSVRFDDDTLRIAYNLTPKQIAMYHQARAAVDTSIDRLAQTYAAQVAQAQGMDINEVKNMALDDTVAIAKDYIQTTHDELRAQEALRKQLEEEGDLEWEMAQAEGKTKYPPAPSKQDTQDLLDSLDAIEEKAKFLKDAGYMPALRFGEYAVTVTNDEGETLHFEMFESKVAANLGAMRLRKEYPGASVEKSVLNPEQYAMFKGVSPETVELFAAFTGADKTEAYQQYIAMARSARSTKMRELKRKGIAGFSEDATRVLASFLTSNARQSAINMNQQEIAQAMGSKTLARKGDVQREAQKLHEYMSNPREEAQAIRGFMFFHMIGGSLASALVNLTQPIMQTSPYLAQFAGAKTPGFMASAAKMAATGKIADADLRSAAEQAAADGITEPHEIHQLMADAGGSAFGDSLMGRAAVKLWGSMFASAESFNRRITFLAAYQVAKDKGMPDPYGFARKAVYETQGIYNKVNRPNWGRGAVGATLFTFKQFSISYIEWLLRLPRKQQLLALGLLVLAAGADGLPFADDIEDVIDTIGQSLGYNTNSKKAMREMLVNNLGETAGTILNTGLLSMSGVDVSGRLGMGNLLPGTAMFKPSEKDKSRTLSEFAGPLGGLLQQAQQSVAKVQAGDLFGRTGAAAALLPKALRDFMQGSEMADTGVYRDARGYKVADVTAGEGYLKMLGLQPSSIASRMRKLSDVMQDRDLVTTIEAEIADRWASGLVEKDADKVAKARQTLIEWNRNNPETPIRINPMQIARRARQMNMDRQARILKTMPKELRAQAAKDLQ